MSHDVSADFVGAERDDPRRAQSRVRLTVVAAVFVVGAAIVYRVAVRTGSGQRLDEAMKGWWVPERARWEGEARHVVNLFGAPLLAIATLVASAVVLHRRRVDALVPLLAIVVGGPMLAQLAKNQLLTRDVLIVEAYPPSNTLPSGHATVVASTAIVAVWLAPLVRRVGAIWVAGLLAATAITLILVAAEHRPSDVVAGVLLAGGWSAAVLAMFGTAVRGPVAAPVVGRGLVLLLAGAVASIAAGVVGAAAAMADDRTADTTSLSVFVAGCALAGGAAVLAVVAPGWAMGPVGVQRADRWRWRRRVRSGGD